MANLLLLILCLFETAADLALSSQSNVITGRRTQFSNEYLG